MTKDTKTTAQAHTPGPWSVSDEGLYILEIGNDAIPVARVDYKSGKTRVSNARLIATAPELLSELRFLHDLLKNSDMITQQEGERIESLLAKAQA